jgi:hypothetical protein
VKLTKDHAVQQEDFFEMNFHPHKYGAINAEARNLSQAPHSRSPDAACNKPVSIKRRCSSMMNSISVEERYSKGQHQVLLLLSAIIYERNGDQTAYKFLCTLGRVKIT